MEIVRNSRFMRAARFVFALSFPVMTLAAGQSLLAQSAVPQQAPVIEAKPSLAGDSVGQLSAEELGDLFMVRKRYEAAIKSYLDAPKTAALYNKLGIAYQQMYNLELAKRSYKLSLHLSSNNANVLNNMATIYYALKDYGQAERYYRKAIRLQPKSALIYKNLGTDLLAQDRFKKGWECYQTALSIDPNIFERNSGPRIGEPTAAHNLGAMNYFLAKSYANAGMTDRAIEYLRMAIAEGFIDRKKVMGDKEFAGLHGIEAYERLISE